jgi:hypothetical protein
MGDGVLVCFGYPQAHEDAARAGLELISAVAGLKMGAHCRPVSALRRDWLLDRSRLIEKERIEHEDRRDRRHRPNRVEDCRHSPPGRPQGQSGINTITGEGLKEAMVDTTVVIDLANSPSDEDKAVMEFFETSGRNLGTPEIANVCRHRAKQIGVGRGLCQEACHG